MAARRKLDAIALKVSLAQWRRLGQGERLMICHAPIESADEREALRIFVEEATITRCGERPKELPDSTRIAADPAPIPPVRLVANAKAAGVALAQREWDSLDVDERYALTKLGDTDAPGPKLVAALKEILPRAGLR